MKFRYPAVSSVQIENGKRLLTFAAPAFDIDIWGGVPQKKRFEDGEETAGFQRDDNPKRTRSLSVFLRDPRNTLQNPLLCSQRLADDSTVSFSAIEAELDLGYVTIEMPDLASMPLVEVFARVKRYLEQRMPSLSTRELPEAKILRLQQLARDTGLTPSVDLEDDNAEADGDAPENSAEDQAGDETAVLFEDSHISDFWDDVTARLEILKKLEGNFNRDEFLGFTREALESYIKPVVIMDGQHRLKGALAAAHQALDEPQNMSEIEKRIDAEEKSDDVQRDLLRRLSRKLSVSLLLDTNPAEHVFQFIVVNQKATPIGRALLGTIVSTSLSDGELETVAERLEAADIPLEESRAASFMARHDSSPFAGKVELGVSGGKVGNKNELLPWPVMVSLVQMFRDLKGGQLYHQPKNDYAKLWADRSLASSPIVSAFQEKGFESPREYWRSFDGPWRDVFVAFWSHVRDYFGELDEPSTWNYWGRPRSSNLYNKISLTILAASFFKYIKKNNVQLKDAAHVAELCKDWLTEIDSRYFSRDWKLERAGVKKDSPGIRSAWSKTWEDYADNPERLPRVENYGPSVV